jgi:hypothetical protein
VCPPDASRARERSDPFSDPIVRVLVARAEAFASRPGGKRGGRIETRPARHQPDAEPPCARRHRTVAAPFGPQTSAITPRVSSARRDYAFFALRLRRRLRATFGAAFLAAFFAALAPLFFAAIFDASLRGRGGLTVSPFRWYVARRILPPIVMCQRKKFNEVPAKASRTRKSGSQVLRTEPIFRAV